MLDFGSRLVVRHARAVLAAVFGITMILGTWATRIEIDTSAQSFLVRSSPSFAFYEEVKSLFGTEDVDLIAIEAADVFHPSTLEKLVRLDERIAAVPGVARVDSLASVDVIRSTPDGDLSYGPLLSSVPVGAEAIARLRADALRQPAIVDVLLTRDARAAALVVTYDAMPIPEFVTSGIQEQVAAILEEEKGPERLHLMGGPTYAVEAGRAMRVDVFRFTPLTALTVFAILLFSFRSARGVLVPMLTIGIGLVWTLGLMALCGVPLDLVSLVLPTLLLAIGSAYATHVVSKYVDEANAEHDAAESARRALRHLGLPVFVTALTTIAGFASLVVYEIDAIRNLGFFITFGVAALFLLSLTFAPALLAVLAPPARTPGATEWPRLRSRLDAIIRFDVRHRAAVLAGAGAILVFFAAKIPDVRVENDFVAYFPTGSDLREASDAIVRVLGGAANLLVSIEAPVGESLLGVGSLERIEALEERIAAVPGVATTSSVVDVVKTAHRELASGRPEDFVLPASDALAAQLLLIVPPDALRAFVTDDGSRAVVFVRSSLVASAALAPAIARIEAAGAEIFPDGFTVRTTGLVPLLNASADSISRGQFQSVLLACVIVLAAMAVFFRSLRLGLVAMVPNAIPVVVFFGVLGWTDVPLSLSTAIIASIALGIGVDEAVHLLAEFHREETRHGDGDRALGAAMKTVGPPVVFTTVALSIGLLAPALSSFVPIREFALLASLNVVTSLAADLFVLPAALASFRTRPLPAREPSPAPPAGIVARNASRPASP